MPKLHELVENSGGADLEVTHHTGWFCGWSDERSLPLCDALPRDSTDQVGRASQHHSAVTKRLVIDEYSVEAKERAGCGVGSTSIHSRLMVPFHATAHYGSVLTFLRNVTSRFAAPLDSRKEARRRGAKEEVTSIMGIMVWKEQIGVPFARASFDDRWIVALIMSGQPDRACNDLDLDLDHDDLDG